MYINLQHKNQIIAAMDRRFQVNYCTTVNEIINITKSQISTNTANVNKIYYTHKNLIRCTHINGIYYTYALAPV